MTPPKVRDTHVTITTLQTQLLIMRPDLREVLKVICNSVKKEGHAGMRAYGNGSK